MPSLFKHLSLLFGLFFITGLHATPETFRYTLKNGMTVLVRPIHKAPVAVSMVWYKVGSKNEHLGLTGLSHVLEHMMFKGTQNLKPGEFSQIIADNGGQENAMTSRDFTAYFQTINSDKLPLCFKLEADRMENLILNAEEFKRELKVVKEERRMRTDDNPQALTRERLMAVMHTANPYHHPVIGWPNDLNQLTVDDAKDWYNLWYAPNNATLVVVGDVTPNKVLTLANQTFGTVQQKTLPPVKQNRSLIPMGKQSLTVNTHAKLPMVILGYKVPSLNSVSNKEEAYALEVITGLLSGGNSARLNKELVRQQKIASNAAAFYDLYAHLDSEFLLYAIPSNKNTLNELNTALRKEITKLKTTLIDEKELTRIKNQLIAGKVFERDSLFGQAMMLGLLESSNLGWQEGERYSGAIEAITPETIQAVAKKYLTSSRLTIANLKIKND